MTCKKMYSVTGAALVFFASSTAYAQLGSPAAPLPQIQKTTGPSLEETTEWISQKISAQPSKILKMEQHVDEQKLQVNFDGCTMTVFNKRSSSGHSQTEYSATPIDLKSLSTVMSVSQEWGKNPWYMLFVKTANGQKTIRTVEINTKTDMGSKMLMGLLNDNVGEQKAMKSFNRDGAAGLYRIEEKSEGYLLVPELEIGERLVGALQHAVKLCQQKDLQDRASRPPRAKELF